ncbi:unnamed protein product, partial [Adineta ricciae]
MFSSTITVPTLPIPDDGICANATWHTNDITLLLIEWGNQRVMRSIKDSKSGTVIMGGRGMGSQPYQLSRPKYLAFDRHGN